MTTELDRIWEHDLFDRRKDAEQLEGYLESVAAQQMRRKNGTAYTIAVDAPYGVGKSFFLKCFAEHVRTRHPVAFVDAWADDIMDEPLSALMATLKTALGPYVKKGPLRTKWQKALKLAGEVAKIAAVGLLKRGIGMVLTASTAEVIHELLKQAPDKFREASEDSSEGAGDEAIRRVEKLVKGDEVLAERIQTFEAGKTAVENFKRSLQEVITGLGDQNSAPPIIIVIDELDRCRPTYAIKLLEEIKHLFDVPGLVFVLGMNGEQLEKSMKVPYGSEFDTQAYMRRFINRTYNLQEPDLTPLVQVLLEETGIDPRQMKWPNLTKPVNGEVSLHKLIALYMQGFNLTAREVPQVITMLQTFVSLCGESNIVAPYALPMIMKRVRCGNGQLNKMDVVDLKLKLNIEFFSGHYVNTGKVISANFLQYYETLTSLSEKNIMELSNINYSTEDAAHVLMISRYDSRNQLNPKFINLNDYDKILASVGKFQEIAPV